ncbi:cytochrome b/b6 domain-containing protein [Sphingomonas qomolangmaensis]|uniref:Cytochrome b/b6 domain-containing protein n=1 Tax=Sphingomonas qomolangmaensis TaxID=2918765 RepID=A0ABY5L8W3_9SPHN|nr:cytochrome b/b6 domain-containing protein [Sphingomonas qomolangmaensis]UUL82292.1 cytochrome b/b6 domain-containing protein [Sphingomonas qomolangmaensis]
MAPRDSNDPADIAAPGTRRAIYKHRLATRLWHWTNAAAVIVLLGSGLMILNAHPQLYWGQYGANMDQPWFRVGWIFEGGRIPGWLTIPSTYNLALARRWHLTVALVFGFALLAFMLVSLLNRHFQRDLRFRRAELAAKHLAHDVREHLALRFHDAADPGGRNVLQKLSYVGVIFVALPLAIFTGLTMSPGINAAAPWMLDLFGGRQSARSIHFIASMGIALFIIVHLTLVILAGPLNEVRSMITGWWHTPQEPQR